MPDLIDSDSLEQQLLAEIAQRKRIISEANREITVLEAILTKARQNQAAKFDVNRKNSVNRILVEDAIRRALKASRRPMSSNDLYYPARDSVVSLKINTFRSHLKRMKDRGIITAVSRGRWVLASAD